MRATWRVVGLCFLLLAAASAAQARNLADMKSAEIKALQQRLTDGGCYHGEIDGQASPTLQAAIGACPSQEPVLRIETAMHVARIWRIGVDRECRVSATASDDKTVRVWSLPEGRLLHTLRVPIGPGEGGKTNAAAVSPDGRWVAAGGWDARWDVAREVYVHIFDVSTGALAARVGPVGGVIVHLAFSPDGRWLAMTSVAGVGLALIDAQTWQIAARDQAYGNISLGAAFGSDGRLYTVSFDGKLRQYGPAPAFRKEREIETRGGKLPRSVAVDPRGEFIAVVFDDSAGVDLYDTQTLTFRSAADTKGVDNGNLFSVAWSSDGARLVAAGMYQARFPAGWKVPLLTFGRDGRRIGGPLPFSDETIQQLQACGDAMAVAASDPAFGLVNGDGRISLLRTGVPPDMRDKIGDAFTIAADARQVRFGLADRGDEPVLFDLEQATLTAAPNPLPGFVAPSIEGLPVANWLNRYNPSFAGNPIALKQFETSHSLAIRADRSGFALGTEWYLRAFDAEGRQIWQEPGPGGVWGVNLSPDGRIVVTAYDDGTIRWYRWTDGKELLALFVNRKTKAWVAWTPSGYYMASPGGEDLIGWQVNRGWSQAGDFFPASKFRDKYAREDIVQRVLDTLDEVEAVRLADLARPTKAASAPIIETLPPVLSILSPADGARVDGQNVTISYLVRSPSGTALDAVESLINAQPAGGRSSGDDDEVKKCIAATRGLGRSEGALQGCRGSLSVALPPGTAEIGVFARAGNKTSDVAKIRVTRAAPVAATERLLKPKLYALVAGISDYANPDYKLEFSAKDARDFAAALANQNGGLYSDVVIKLLVDGQATSAAIKDGLDWLTHQVTEHDVGLVYLAGHGIVDERSRFYFLATDSDAGRLRATAVAKDDISDALDGLPGKALLFLDACHSGSVAGSGRRAVFDFNNVVDEFLHSERGVVVFAASTGRQLSMEDRAWGNGAFTKALVEGIGRPGAPGRAAIEGTITPALLDAYVARRVKELTNGRQSPVMNSTAPDFPIAVVR